MAERRVPTVRRMTTIEAPEAVSYDCGDVALRGDRWTGGDRGQVLFLHGGGQTRHSWGGAAQALAGRGWITTTLDLRGHGDSDWSPDGTYGMDRYAADIARVVEQMGRGVVLVGASLGGLTSLSVAGRDPSAARALVLVDIVPRTAAAGVQRIGEFMRAHLDGFDDLDQVADAIAAYTKRPRRTNPEGLKKNVRRREDGRWYWHWDPAMMQIVPDDEPRPGTRPEPLLDLARAVTAPVLVVRGGRSDVVDDEGIAEFLAVVPHARVVDVAEAGHMVAGDDNDDFTSAVDAFLEELSTPA
ncbi:Pimeloyl-ACP methyl ester carboxylesterase [Trujillonella endophytica]|uniref:Pimeloyl-ACP methyl ester carboxylesterase n=2 Tax=Trujillonella endophytica TaxID=673521 RepID=A0A1H8RPH1_9ACTN|nr:Pimeloyl-ACP methyl ester carboxylesterase [Trujillella endophytica]